MKKSILFIALALAFASCGNTYEEWAAPQGNEQEAAKTVNMTLAEAPAINFATLNTDSVQLFAPTMKVEDPATNVYTVTLFNADKSKSKQIKAYADGKVKASELEEAFIDLWGRRPQQRDVALHVEAFTTVNGMSIRNEGNTTAKITPDSPVLEDHYYYMGTNNAWSKTDKSLELQNGGGDLYDDPVISIIIPSAKNADNTIAAENTFKIIPQSAYDRGTATFFDGNIIGVAANGAEGMSGSFVVGKNDEVANAFKINQTAHPGKYYKIELNLLEKTYNITAMNDPELFLTGSNYGWGGTWVPLVPVHSTTDTFWKIIYLHANEEIKFAPQAGWSNDFGSQATINDQAGAGITDNGGNIKVANAGWYLLVVVNGSARKLTILRPEVYLMGSTAPVNNWTIDSHNAFTIPTTDNGEFISPAIAANGELRMCIKLDTYDWWKTEFMVTTGGRLSYRGKGGDQAHVNVLTGQKVHINFTNGTGSYQ
ncbi:MAG: DUF5115 domain-containing protein [Prevotellaceae bacterium]|nr:DUF5115 domain-containing protein [Prevotellaceae bacterium]